MVVRSHTLAFKRTPLELSGGRGTRAHTERKRWPRAALPHQMSNAGAPDVPEAHAGGKQRSVSRPRALYLPDGGRQPNTFNCMRLERCTSSRPELKLAARSPRLTGSTQDDDSSHHPFQHLRLLWAPHRYHFQKKKKTRQFHFIPNALQMLVTSPNCVMLH